MFDPQIWATVPFHFWSLVFFVFGCVVGSFLNVCIHRLPRGESVVSPPSHCPHCNYAIPWYLNIPLATWVYLRGRCANCKAPISARYFVVELLTGMFFLSCWLTFGHRSASLALVYCLVLGGLIVATFVDFEHFIIPDEVTMGGMAAGFLCSFLVPELHWVRGPAQAMKQSFWGIAVGGGLVYGILQLGKLLFGRQKIKLAPGSKIIFTETALCLPEQEILYGDVLYRKTDTIVVQARTVEMVDRCYSNTEVRLSSTALKIGGDTWDPETVPWLEVVADQVVLPREAMGLGDVKFMAAIGAFLGWPAVFFSLMLSAMIGATVGVALVVLRQRAWSSRIPYGPYIALAATIWIFGGRNLVLWWLRVMAGG